MASLDRTGPFLYTRLGGYDAIAAVVDSLLERMRGDITAATGGPTFYLGRDMKTSHAGMGITRSDYQALVHHTVAALDGFKVPDREKNEVLAFLATLEPEIVEK
jgi:hemoglobin